MSMSDWDDKKNGGSMVLSTTEVYEGAKSLRLGKLANDYAIKILELSEIDNPKNVTVDFWGYLTGFTGARIALFFRYQDLNNYYSVELRADQSDNSRMRLCLREDGNLSTVDSCTDCVAGGFNAWNNWKIETCEIGGVFYVLMYTKVGAAWVLQKTMTHTPAKFTSGGAYGVGVENYSSGDYAYLDTTKIYY